jgi:hypothetical protein
MEFANSVPYMKPFFDYDMSLNLELMDIINTLKQDSDRDVIESVEQCDYKLLQQKKRSKEEEKLNSLADQERQRIEAKLA